MPLVPPLIEYAMSSFKGPEDKMAFIDHNGNLFYAGTNDPWIPVTERQPKGSPIVFMYSESNNEFSCGHFTLNRGGVPVTHWQPCIGPRKNDS